MCELDLHWYNISAWWSKRLYTIPCKRFLKISEDIEQILLMLEVLFSQVSVVEELFCGPSSGPEPNLFVRSYLFGLGFRPIQDDFQYDFARVINEAMGFLVLAEL